MLKYKIIFYMIVPTNLKLLPYPQSVECYNIYRVTTGPVGTFVRKYVDLEASRKYYFPREFRQTVFIISRHQSSNFLMSNRS